MTRVDFVQFGKRICVEYNIIQEQIIEVTVHKWRHAKTGFLDPPLSQNFHTAAVSHSDRPLSS